MVLNEETLALLKEACGKPAPRIMDPQPGLVCYDLSYPASLIWPMLTPLRNRLPRTPGVPDPVRGRPITLGEENSGGYECGLPGADPAEIESRQWYRLLMKTMVKEETAILSGNRSMQLGTPAPAVLSSTSRSTRTRRLINVAAVALTLEGWLNSYTSGHGIATKKRIVGSDGDSFVLNGGSSHRSPDSIIMASPDDVVSAWVEPVHGGVSYGWFAGVPGHEALQCITPTNSVVFREPILSGNQPLSQIVEDCSSNPAFAYDGLMTSAFMSPGAYVDIRPTGELGIGTPLTRSERGGVEEIDRMLAGMAERGLAVDEIFVNLRELKQIKTLMGAEEIARYPALRDGSGEVRSEDDGPAFGPLLSLHPRLPPGTILGWADKYCVVSEAEAAKGVLAKESATVLTRLEYYAVEWPIVTRQKQVGVYVEEWLDVRKPEAMAIITNIGG